MTITDDKTGVTVTTWRRGEVMWEFKASYRNGEAFFTAPKDFPLWALLPAGQRALGLPLSENDEDVLELADSPDQRHD